MSKFRLMLPTKDQFRSRQVLSCAALLLVLASTGLGACRGREVRKPEEGLPATFAKRLERYFDLRVVLFGSNEKEIVSKLGRPLETRVKRIPSPHQPDLFNDSIEMLYDGLSITVFKQGSVPFQEFIEIVTVSSPHWVMPWNLNVGSLRTGIREILGPPSHVEGLIEGYDIEHFGSDGFPMGYQDYLSFTYENDVVRAILFQLPLD